MFLSFLLVLWNTDGLSLTVSAEEAAKPVPHPDNAPDVVHKAPSQSSKNQYVAAGRKGNNGSNKVHDTATTIPKQKIHANKLDANDAHDEYNVTPMSAAADNTPLRKSVKKPPPLRYVVARPTMSSVDSTGGGSGALGSTLLSVRM